MRPPRFDLRALRAIVAVRDAGSITAAARLLGMGQPALSRLVAAVEAELGFRLFTRAGRRLQPLAAAAGFLERANAILVAADRLGMVALDLQAGRRPAIRLVSLPNLALGPLQGALASFATRFPDLEVQVQIRDRTELLRLLSRGECDFGAAVLPVQEDGTAIHPFAEAEAICLLPQDHALARVRMVTPRALDGAELVVLPEWSMLRPRVDAAFAAAGATYRRRFTVDTGVMAARFVAAGLGVAVMQPLDRGVMPEGVVARPFRPSIRLTYVLIERTDAGLGTLARALAEELRRGAATLGGRALPG